MAHTALFLETIARAFSIFDMICLHVSYLEQIITDNLCYENTSAIRMLRCKLDSQVKRLFFGYLYKYITNTLTLGPVTPYILPRSPFYVLSRFQPLT